MRTLLFLLTVFSATAGEWSRSYQVGNSPDLEIRVDDGGLEFTSGAPGVVDARVVTKGWEIRPGEVEIVESQTGDRVRIHVKLPKGITWKFGDRSLRAIVVLPPGVRLSGSTGDGGITATGVSGDLRLNTGDGGIRGQDLAGTLEARTGDGGITVSGRFDGVRLNTGDGGVDVTALPGSKLATAWAVDTGDGGVRLRVPPDIRADLDARTADGSLRVDLPGVSRSGSDDHEMRASINGGGQPLRIRSGDGSITITPSR